MAGTSGVKITSVHFENFKAFDQYALSMDAVNILVGPNNSGKSTIIGALRALDSGIRVARSRSPQRVFFGSGSEIGYRVPEDSLPISLENVHTNYNTDDSVVTFNLSNRNKLKLVFSQDGGCVLLPEAENAVIRTAALFKSQFPISLTVVPVLGPVEHREVRREKSTVVDGLSTHRASRHFRSYWHYFDSGFEDFARLVETTWPGMQIGRPEFDAKTGELSMFCLEERMTRELYWVGFGFQVWCQLLTHLSRARGSSLVVVDEPEIYLHPDVQRQLLGIVRDIGTQILLATHSSEIMSEADPSEIVLIDKRKRAAERLKDISGVQRALDAVGSAQNITLTALARSRRVLFVEGDYDFRLLRRIARKLGMHELSAGLGITPLESGGFASWERVTTLASGVAEALGAPLIIAAVYDRDYNCTEQIAEVVFELSKSLRLAHAHARKEIENYLLVPEAIDRALEKAVSERLVRDRRALPKLPSAATLLREITEPLRDGIQSQIMARRWDHLRGSGRDLAEINRDTISWFSPRWADLTMRLTLVPGKEVLATLRARLQGQFGTSLTDARIVDAMHRDDVAEDMRTLLANLDEFRRIKP
jgi:AAA domain, putative AbiEii toxin, Type IV TA system/AAA ATPase domain